MHDERRDDNKKSGVESKGNTKYIVCQAVARTARPEREGGREGGRADQQHPVRG